MNTQVKNFSLVRGAQSKIVVHLDEEIDTNSIQVYAGNDKCKCRHLVYHEVSRDEHSITLVSDPAPANTPSMPYQIFVKNTTTNTEWLVVSGNVSILPRYVGCDHEIELNPPLENEIIDVDFEVVFSKADLEEAVKLAQDAAACAENQAYCASVHSATSRVYSENARTFAWDAGSSANEAKTYATQAGSAKDNACSAAGSSYSWSQTALTYKNQSCNASATANASMAQACAARSNSCTAAGRSCNYSNTARDYAACTVNLHQSVQSLKQQTCQYKQTTCGYLDEVTGIAATKQDKLTAGTNISITKVGEDTYICATGGGEGDVKLDADNEFTGFNYFNNDNGIALLSSGNCNHLYNNNGLLYWGTDQVLTSGDRTSTPSAGSNNVITSGGVYAHTSNNGIHVTSAQKTSWNNHVSSTDVHVTTADKTKWNNHANDSGIHLGTGEKEFILNRIRMDGALTFRTQAGTNRGNHQWLTLDKKWVVPGMLTHVGIGKRDTSGTVVNNVYLMVFQMAEGGNPLSPSSWPYIGTSTNSVTADYGTGKLGWDFNDVELAGNRPIAFKFTQNPNQTTWSPHTTIGLRLGPTVTGDCTYVEGQAGKWAPSCTQMTTMVNTFEYYKELEVRVKALEDRNN